MKNMLVKYVVTLHFTLANLYSITFNTICMVIFSQKPGITDTFVPMVCVPEMLMPWQRHCFGWLTNIYNNNDWRHALNPAAFCSIQYFVQPLIKTCESGYNTTKHLTNNSRFSYRCHSAYQTVRFEGLVQSLPCCCLCFFFSFIC